MNHFVKSAIRHWQGKPVNSLITFTGFTFGIIASLLIYLWVYNELQYEKFHPDYQRIYRVLTLSKQGDEIVKSPSCYMPVAKTMKKDYAQIESATYLNISSEDSPLQPESGGEKIEARMGWTDESFFKIFAGFIFLEGSAETAFEKVNSVVLSEKTAMKLFGEQPALGKTLISDKYSKEIYTVGGVVRIPEQSHLDFGFLLPEKNSHFAVYSDSWHDKGFVRVYIKLKKNAKIDDDFLTAASNHLSRYSSITDKLMFQPLADVHLHSDYPHYMFDKNPGSFKYVWIFTGLAFLIVLMASFNFSVLSVARAFGQSTEIGVRKVFGARKAGIFRQFMAESVSQTIAATVLSILIVLLILPWFNSISGKDLVLNLSGKFACNLLLLTLIVGTSAGIYPSLYLSSFSPDRVFRKEGTTGSRNNFIRLLVTTQFSFAVFFFIIMSLFVKQMNYINNKDLGIEKNNIVVIPTGLWYSNEQFKQALLKNSRISGVSASSYAPVDFSFRHGLPLSHLGRMDTLQVNLFWVDEDFAKTYKLEIVKGQFLQMDYSGYWKELEKTVKSRKDEKEYTMSIPIVINQTAEKMLGFDDPIGQRIGDNVIVGVVKDFHYRPIHFPIGPLVMTNNPESIMTMNVHIAPGNTAETLEFIRDTYRKFREDREFTYSFFDDLLNEKYHAERYLRNITILFAILAIVISVLGILGMAVFSIDRRTKEIGIRKVTGAKVTEILVLLNKEFILWVMVAFIIAAPVAWYALHKWLQNFAYKTELSWWVFAAAGAVAMAVALLTVSWQSWRAATRNPVEALRYE